MGRERGLLLRDWQLGPQRRIVESSTLEKLAAESKSHGPMATIAWPMVHGPRPDLAWPGRTRLLRLAERSLAMGSETRLRDQRFNANFSSGERIVQAESR